MLMHHRGRASLVSNIFNRETEAEEEAAEAGEEMAEAEVAGKCNGTTT